MMKRIPKSIIIQAMDIAIEKIGVLNEFESIFNIPRNVADYIEIFIYKKELLNTGLPEDGMKFRLEVVDDKLSKIHVKINPKYVE